MNKLYVVIKEENSMGLFTKKPKEPEYDAVDCERKKKE